MKATLERRLTEVLTAGRGSGIRKFSRRAFGMMAGILAVGAPVAVFANDGCWGDDIPRCPSGLDGIGCPTECSAATMDTCPSDTEYSHCWWDGDSNYTCCDCVCDGDFCISWNQIFEQNT